MNEREKTIKGQQRHIGALCFNLISQRSGLSLDYRTFLLLRGCRARAVDSKRGAAIDDDSQRRKGC